MAPAGETIVDVHMHLGRDVVYDHEFTAQDLCEAMEACGVDVGIVQPFVVAPLHEPQRRIHDEVYRLTQGHPGRFYGMASLNPHCGEEFYRTEMRRCVRDLGFLGLKLHPVAHATNPTSRDGRMAFEVARELNVPLMVHTGNTRSFALPTQLFYLAREFDDIPIVMAHAGGGCYGEALLVAKENDNVFLDMSWCPPGMCMRFWRELGAPRLMFATDHPSNVPAELSKWRSLGLSPGDLEWVLGRTAREVYSIGPSS
jgi:predicted TIM-barrel fold metal-dependent hydrolase